MQEFSDLQLLRRYAENGDDSAFHELVARTTNFVYSAALRQTSNPDLARDISQIVFTELARKAAAINSRLTSDASLLGWLFNATRFEALNHFRADRRRKTREQNFMAEPPADSDCLDWDQISPVLDSALTDLSEPDR